MTTSVPPHERHILVVGGGPAAHRFTLAFLQGAPSDVLVTVVSEEAYQPYDRVALSSRLRDGADLTLSSDVWRDPRVNLLSGCQVTVLDTDEQSVCLSDGRVLLFDELVLATGSSAPVPPIEGAELASVYRTVGDVDRLATLIDSVPERSGRPARIVVAGGGLLGLEAAGAFADQGADVSVVHSGRWLMSAQLDEGAGRALERLIEQRGISVHCGVRPTAVRQGVAGEQTVTLTDDTVLAADAAVFAIGITPRDELARDAGLRIGERGGVVVGSDCGTAHPHVWAIGEVACALGKCTGLVAPANAMAETVADRLLGGSAEFTRIDDSTKLKLSGVDVASFGDALAHSDHAMEVVYADPARGMYQKLVMSDDARTLLGAIFVGDAEPYASLRPLVGSELSAEPSAYLSVSDAAPSDDELPDSALVCACNSVDAGAIRSAVCEGGCTSVGEVKACTRAGTQCGSCIPLVKKIVDAELVNAGMSVSTALCEHFEMSRRDLFETVRVLELRHFDEIIERLGMGRGCDVCKPVIASILASQFGSYVLDDGRGALQDTNDRALANMQKDGSYSVVPRVPGGEITPQKLAVIAEVAQDFDLYTKITGGQRIDLFGAQLEELPAIWARLVDAGFESGHAYGKALRNVKSCVGSTWCRFGVQDSVGMAVELELRYRGLRSPHKLKIGVSGCARECAEARSKDVGVIATENGWNVYVGGNGGFQPTHGQLLASDVDDDTLIRYIDRFLMYYIRTADRLQRTARWIEDIDGGLNHVHDVVVGDSLGLAADLESAMQAHVGSYRDEWAETLADPERLRRFRSFVNAPNESTPQVPRVTQRGQNAPATLSEHAPVTVSGPRIPVRERG
ncbi:nitrite reductase large subunit NirB [Paramicrobacterium fandaimingii]|uniref:nitrite reductase large subunit NirB n=1 Tax=Paramicrobacterium fandaimingii TaxID=2708079 RepID=UPI001420592B|nr:nitrite reductase large subunit NirB [Microbacterium fandaimingii]